MPINYDKLEEGDALTAASLNSRLTSAGGAGQGVNNITQADIERQALRSEQLPSIITNSDFPNGLVKLAPSSISLSNPYLNTLNVLATGAVPVPDYQTFDTGVPNGPYGPATAQARGWRIIADSNVTANAAQIIFGPLTATTATPAIGNYKGLLIRLGVGYDSFVQGYGTPAYESIPSVIVGIGWEDQAGNRFIIERSIRWFNAFSSVKGSLETFTFIQAADIGNTNQINKIFGVIAGGSWGLTDNGYRPPVIKYYNIDMIPIRAGELNA